MQLHHGDNLGKGFCTRTRAYITALVPSALVLWFVCACAKPFPKIVPMAKLDIYLFSISGIRKKAAENIQMDVLHPEFRLLKRSRSFDRSSWTLDNLHARTEGFSGKAKLLEEGIFSWLRFLSWEIIFFKKLEIESVMVINVGLFLHKLLFRSKAKKNLHTV